MLPAQLFFSNSLKLIGHPFFNTSLACGPLICIARTVEKGIGKHGMEKTLLSVGLGCQAKYAKDFVYADSLNLNDKKTETPIGVNCRTCDRMDCQQRAFPPLHKKFDIGLNKRGISVYVAD